MHTEHLLERRARMLADGMLARKNMLTQALLPKGSRPPFTQQLSEKDALSFWQRNRHSALGKKVLERMSTEDILELDLALSKAAEGELDAGNTTEY